MPRAAALQPATSVVLLMVFGTVAEATRISGAPPDSEVTAELSTTAIEVASGVAPSGPNAAAPKGILNNPADGACDCYPGFGIGCSQPCTVNSCSQHGRCRGWTGECDCFEGYQGDDCSEPSAPPVLKITISLALSMDGFTPSVQLSVLGATSAAAGVDPTKVPAIQRAALTV